MPLEKQKLNHLPIQLLNLVEKVVNAKDGAVPGSAQINEWAQTVGSFLKQTNWGENIGKASQQLGNIQKSLTRTFGKKTVTEQKKTFNDAPVSARVKSAAIDLVLVALLIVGMWIAWWPVQRVVFGATMVAETSASHDISNGSYERVGDDYYYVRHKGIIEWLIDVNVRFPFILLLVYFAIFWKIKHATPGQIASGTAVIQEDGSTEVPLALAFKRSAMFLVSCFTIFGVLMIFVGEKKTLYDKVCKTRVVS